MSHQLLEEFLVQHANKNNVPEALVSVISTLASCCQEIQSKVRLGELSGVLGEAGTGNVQGEAQKKLDVIANQMLIQALSKNTAVAGLASEEEENFVSSHIDGEYLVLFDPLDGSSNIDVNISVGTIFSVLARQNKTELTVTDFLQSGKKQVAAGYCLYGPQTMFVLTLGHGVFVFTLDETKKAFVLTRENIKIAEETEEFAINMSNQRHWQQPVQQYIAQLLAGKDGVRNKNYNMRWVASMVAEVHRILTRGGIFMYPRDARDLKKAGKLRLMYEANPMSLLIVQAGGESTNGLQDTLTIQPDDLHQRVAVFLGSSEEVEYVTKLHE